MSNTKTCFLVVILVAVLIALWRATAGLESDAQQGNAVRVSGPADPEEPTLRTPIEAAPETEVSGAESEPPQEASEPPVGGGPVATLSTKVVRENGRSAVGARVVAIAEMQAPMLAGLSAAEVLENPLVRTATTLDNGWFLMTGLAVGSTVDVPYEVLATLDGRLAREIVLPPVGRTELRLAPVHAARLHFVEPNGRDALTLNRLRDDSGARFSDPGGGVEFLPSASLAYDLLGVAGDESHWTLLLFDERGASAGESIEFMASFPGYHPVGTTVAVVPLSEVARATTIVLDPYPGGRGSLTLRLPDFPDVPADGFVGAPLIARLRNLDGHIWRIPVREIVEGEVTLTDLPHGRYDLVFEWRPRIERVPAYGEKPFVVEVCEAAPRAYEFMLNLTRVPLEILDPNGEAYTGPLTLEFSDSQWFQKFHRPAKPGQLAAHFLGPPYELVLPLPAVQAIVGRERLSAMLVTPFTRAGIRLQASSPGRVSGDWSLPKFASDREVLLSTTLAWR